MQMQNRVYADDCLSEESEVDEFQQSSCEIIRSASMERRKWSGHNIISSEAGMKVLTTRWVTELESKVHRTGYSESRSRMVDTVLAKLYRKQFRPF